MPSPAARPNRSEARFGENADVLKRPKSRIALPANRRKGSGPYSAPHLGDPHPGVSVGVAAEGWFGMLHGFQWCPTGKSDLHFDDVPGPTHWHQRSWQTAALAPTRVVVLGQMTSSQFGRAHHAGGVPAVPRHFATSQARWNAVCRCHRSPYDGELIFTHQSFLTVRYPFHPILAHPGVGRQQA
jgi:hypothetical protein